MSLVQWVGCMLATTPRAPNRGNVLRVDDLGMLDAQRGNPVRTIPQTRRRKGRDGFAGIPAVSFLPGVQDHTVGPVPDGVHRALEPRGPGGVQGSGQGLGLGDEKPVVPGIVAIGFQERRPARTQGRRPCRSSPSPDETAYPSPGRDPRPGSRRGGVRSRRWRRRSALPALRSRPAFGRSPDPPRSSPCREPR